MVLLPTDFKSYDINKYRDVSVILQPFKSIINAVCVSSNKKFLTSDPVVKNWDENIKSIFPEKNLRIKILNRRNTNKTLIDHVNMNCYDLLVLFHKKQSLIRGLFSNSLIYKVIKKTSIPVLLYSKVI